MSLIAATTFNQLLVNTSYSQAVCGKTPDFEQSSAYKVGQAVRELFDNAAVSVGQIFSSLSRGFTWIDSFLPSFIPNFIPVANAQEVLTTDENCFLEDLEVNVRLVKIAPEDRRYLRKVKHTLDNYMEKNELQAFPPHMSKATILLTKLTNHEFIDLTHGVPLFDKRKPLSENCFYDQLDKAVQAANFAQTPEEGMVSVRVINTLIEEFLTASDCKLFKPDVLQKVSMITNKLGCLQKMIFTRGSSERQCKKLSSF